MPWGRGARTVPSAVRGTSEPTAAFRRVPRVPRVPWGLTGAVACTGAPRWAQTVEPGTSGAAQVGQFGGRVRSHHSRSHRLRCEVEADSVLTRGGRAGQCSAWSSRTCRAVSSRGRCLLSSSSRHWPIEGSARGSSRPRSTGGSATRPGTVARRFSMSDDCRDCAGGQACVPSRGGVDHDAAAWAGGPRPQHQRQPQHSRHSRPSGLVPPAGRCRSTGRWRRRTAT